MEELKKFYKTHVTNRAAQIIASLRKPTVVASTRKKGGRSAALKIALNNLNTKRFIKVAKAESKLRENLRKIDESAEENAAKRKLEETELKGLFANIKTGIANMQLATERNRMANNKAAEAAYRAGLPAREAEARAAGLTALADSTRGHTVAKGLNKAYEFALQKP